MGYWKDKVFPKIKKVFEGKGGAKKAAAAEAIKSFDGSKVEMEKEFEEKKEDLKPKVLEIYEKSSVEVKTVVKERTQAGLKNHSESVNKFLEELVKIEFPGSKHACEASSKCGPNLVSSVVFFVFEKVSIFVPVEESKAETTAETSEPPKEKEVVVESEKKEEERKEEPKEASPPSSSTTTEEAKSIEVKEAVTSAPEPPKTKPEGEEPKKA